MPHHGFVNRFHLILLLFVAALVAGIIYLRTRPMSPSVSEAQKAGRVGCREAAVAFRGHESDVWLTIRASVQTVLPDEEGTSVHQRFIVACTSGQTVLIVNNVDVGSRLPVHGADVVVVHGQYIWNREGGIIHYTHRGNGSLSGWILLRGHVYAEGTRGQSSGQRSGKRLFEV